MMEMMTIPMTVPKSMAPYLDDTDRDHSFERNAMMLYPFIQSRTISVNSAGIVTAGRKRFRHMDNFSYNDIRLFLTVLMRTCVRI